MSVLDNMSGNPASTDLTQHRGLPMANMGLGVMASSSANSSQAESLSASTHSSKWTYTKAPE